MSAGDQKQEEHRHHHHSHTHHHRHSHEARVRRRNFLAASCAAVVLAAGVCAGIFYQAWEKHQSYQVTAENTYDASTSSYRKITWNGEEYTYNNLVTCILYAGVDSTGKMEASVQYGNKARADSIALVVLDKYNDRLSVLAINRDTMTQIRRYSMTGNDDGLYTSHIGYAYTWGDGGEVSCENLCEAVSLLLGGIPILDYVVTNQDSMTYINNLVGGVTVTVPNSELAEEYPELYEGAQVQLDDTNIRAFLQYRDTSEDFSNEGRMERQQTYVTAYIETVRGMNTSQIEEAWDNLADMDDYMQTSITENKYLDLAELVQELEFTDDSYIQLEGEDEAGELHDEFYADEDALQELIIDLFYIRD